MFVKWLKRYTSIDLPTPWDKDAVIELGAVNKSYHSGEGKFDALKSVSLKISPGEFVAVVGKSGCGKSTLVNIIAGIDRPSSGEVWVAGIPVHKLTENQAAVWRGRAVGIVFQFFQLLPTLTTLENVMLPMDFCNTFPASERPDRARYLLEIVGVADQAKKLPANLSGGQQQRVAIARALANDPPILLADEPTGNLDSRTGQVVIELFSQLAETGTTVILVTHDDDLTRQGSRIITIVDGRIASDLDKRAYA